MIEETLPAGHEWYRICDPAWGDPLDGTFAALRGGRWNPPGSWRTLYLNEDLRTARLNLDVFIAHWPFEPEDLTDAAGPDLVVATLPRGQRVADVHTRAGVLAAGMPPTYPLDADEVLLPHSICQGVGERVRADGLRGVHCRSAAGQDGRELAWYPATVRSRAQLVRRMSFREWYWD